MKKKLSKEELEALRERYYEGATTPEEEALLYGYLLENKEDKADVADKAVAAYMLMKRRQTAHQQRRISMVRWASAAAAILVLVIFAGKLIINVVAPQSENWAMLDGTLYNSENVAMQQMEQTLAAALDCYPTIESELSNMFIE